jgi:hypothetical protein
MGEYRLRLLHYGTKVMNAKAYLEKIDSKLRLPREIRKDVLSEISSHINNFIDPTKMEKVMGDPETFAKSVNKARKVNMPEILFLPSTWLEIVKITIFSIILFFVLSLVLMMLLGALGSNFTRFDFYTGFREPLTALFPSMPIRLYLFIENISRNFTIFLILGLFLVTQVITIAFTIRQKTFSKYPLQSHIALFVSAFPVSYLLYTLITQSVFYSQANTLLYIVCLLTTGIILSILLELQASRLENRVLVAEKTT